MTEKVITGCNNCPHATFVRDELDYRKDGGYCSLRPLGDQQVSTGDFLWHLRPPLCPLPNPFSDLTVELSKKMQDAMAEAKSYGYDYQELVRQQIGTALKDLEIIIGHEFDDNFFSSTDNWLPSSRNC